MYVYACVCTPTSVCIDADACAHVLVQASYAKHWQFIRHPVPRNAKLRRETHNPAEPPSEARTSSPARPQRPR